MKTLKEIFAFLQSRKKAPEGAALDLEVDSRAVNPGDVFVAVKGTKVNGLDYALKAQEKGAALIVYENDNELPESLEAQLVIPALKIPEIKKIDINPLGIGSKKSNSKSEVSNEDEWV